MDERQALAAIRNAVRLEGLSEDVARRVAPQLREIFTELGKQFRAMPPGNIEREVWYRQQRLRIAELFRAPNDELRGYLQATLGDEVYRQMHFAESYLKKAGEDPETLISATMPQDGVNINMNNGPTSIGRGVQFTREQLHQITQETRVLGERLEDLFTSSIDNDTIGPWIRQNLGLIDRVVKTGFLTGQTADQVAAQIPGLDRESTRRNKAIARTALMDMSARAQEAFWLANSDVVAGFEFDSSLDDRVCHLCAPWNGKFAEKITQLPKTPVHVNCRCRVLPLTHAEMLLREEEGEQRQTVMELIEAKSKDDAIAKAKLKPDAIGARAYASQVKYKGKKYWRVAVDLKRPNKPYTMGDFLKQASPQTQAKVLGSEKRAREFMRKVLGTKDKAPISPDRALREVVNFRPVITRQPRLSMDMKLDISRLKSQKELMKQATEGDKFGVYAYLREDGTPYYIGKMKDERRAFSRQHNAKPPPRGHEHRVRLLRGNLTEQEAFDWERRYIARYGRKNNGTGILRNLTDGGEGASGAILPASARATISRKAKERLRDPLKLEAQREKARLAAEIQLREKAKKLGIPFDEYAKMTPHKRAALGAIARRGKKYGINEADWLKLSPEQRQAYGRKAASVPRGISEKTVAAAKRHGMTIEQWNSLTRSEQLKANKRLRDGMTDLTGDLSDNVMKNAAAKYQISLEKWKALSLRDRNIVAQRYAKGVRGAALIDQRDPMMMKAAEKYQIPYERWVGLTAKERSLVKDRFIRGQRGDDLLADFGMSGGDVRLKKKAESLGFSFEFWKGLTDRQRNSINARNRRTGLRGKALLEGLL